MSSKKFFHSVVCHRRVKLRPHPTQVGSIVLVFGFVSDLKPYVDLFWPKEKTRFGGAKMVILLCGMRKNVSISRVVECVKIN